MFSVKNSDIACASDPASEALVPSLAGLRAGDGPHHVECSDRAIQEMLIPHGFWVAPLRSY